jgi:hypothetical protein
MDKKQRPVAVLVSMFSRKETRLIRRCSRTPVVSSGRTIRVGRRTWDALQFLADGKEPDERIIAITDERIRQILTAAARPWKRWSRRTSYGTRTVPTPCAAAQILFETLPSLRTPPNVRGRPGSLLLVRYI